MAGIWIANPSKSGRSSSRAEFWIAVVGGTGKVNQRLHILDPGGPPAMIGVEVRNRDGQFESWDRADGLEQAGPDDHVFGVEV